MQFCKEYNNKVYSQNQIDTMNDLCPFAGVYTSSGEFRIYCFEMFEAKLNPQLTKKCEG